MAELKLKGPVGFTGRTDGDKVKNNPADVDLPALDILSVDDFLNDLAQKINFRPCRILW